MTISSLFRKEKGIYGLICEQGHTLRSWCSKLHTKFRWTWCNVFMFVRWVISQLCLEYKLSRNFSQEYVSEQKIVTIYTQTVIRNSDQIWIKNDVIMFKDSGSTPGQISNCLYSFVIKFQISCPWDGISWCEDQGHFCLCIILSKHFTEHLYSSRLKNYFMFNFKGIS